jgi:hypothetical protein
MKSNLNNKWEIVTESGKVLDSFHFKFAAYRYLPILQKDNEEKLRIRRIKNDKTI